MLELIIVGGELLELGLRMKEREQANVDEGLE